MAGIALVWFDSFSKGASSSTRGLAQCGISSGLTLLAIYSFFVALNIK
jgi:hypothetical protein